MHFAPLLLLATLLPQEEAGSRAVTEDPSRDLVLELAAPAEYERRLSWSPKGAAVPLIEQDGLLVGSFALGPEGAPPVRVELRRTEGAESWDVLALDADRDGVFSESEVQSTTTSERNRKIWSSFDTVDVHVPTIGPDGKPTVQRYPMSLWFVLDLFDEEAPLQLRWSRRGWLQGSAKLDEETELHVVLTESVMDGVYTMRDSWSLGATHEEALTSRGYPGLTRHAWHGEQAWRVVEVHPSGLRMTLRPIDIGMTRAEEEAAQRARANPDADAPRAEQPLQFGHDYAVAMATAKEQGKPVFLDFETTWCGPCKQMDAYVYTAQAVVDAAAASGVVPVKLDGDVQRELVKKYAVAGYPTLILLDAEGNELRRAVGYQSVEKMTAFLERPEPEEDA